MTPEVFEGQGIGIAFSPGRVSPSKIVLILYLSYLFFSKKA